MTLKELRALVTDAPASLDNLEVKVWLPGSRISLSGQLGRLNDVVIIEGNVDPGSALAGEG